MKKSTLNSKKEIGFLMEKSLRRLIDKIKLSSAIQILYILPALILVANSSVAQSSEENLHSDQDISSIVAEFVRLLDKVKTPTIEDYQKFFGYSDVKELHFHWRNCEKNDQTPFLKNTDCFKSLVDAWKTKDESPSLYWNWIRRQLPDKPSYEITSIRKISIKKKYFGALVQLRLNEDIDLELWAPSKDPEKYGLLSLQKVNDVPMDILLQQESELSILVALGLKRLLRNLTKSEKQMVKSKREKECKKDPVCKKQLDEDKLRKKQRKQERIAAQRFGDSFKKWCRINFEQCNKYNKGIEELHVIHKKQRISCEKDHLKCVKDIKEWMSMQVEVKKEFCGKYKDECQALDENRIKRIKRDADWCDNNQKKCARVYKKYDIALFGIYSGI